MGHGQRHGNMGSIMDGRLSHAPGLVWERCLQRACARGAHVCVGPQSEEEQMASLSPAVSGTLPPAALSFCLSVCLSVHLSVLSLSFLSSPGPPASPLSQWCQRAKLAFFSVGVRCTSLLLLNHHKACVSTPLHPYLLSSLAGSFPVDGALDATGEACSTTIPTCP